MIGPGVSGKAFISGPGQRWEVCLVYWLTCFPPVLPGLCFQLGCHCPHGTWAPLEHILEIWRPLLLFPRQAQGSQEALSGCEWLFTFSIAAEGLFSMLSLPRTSEWLSRLQEALFQNLLSLVIDFVSLETWGLYRCLDVLEPSPAFSHSEDSMTTV